jgi:hypothetical protein
VRVAPEALEKLYSAKERNRRRLAALPFHEKIDLVVAMQRRADAIIRSRGGAGRTVWKRAVTRRPSPEAAVTSPGEEESKKGPTGPGAAEEVAPTSSRSMALRSNLW